MNLPLTPHVMQYATRLQQIRITHNLVIELKVKKFKILDFYFKHQVLYPNMDVLFKHQIYLVSLSRMIKTPLLYMSNQFRKKIIVITEVAKHTHKSGSI